MKTNTQDILLKIKKLPPRKNHGMCVEQQFTQAKCVTSNSRKIEDKTRGLGSDLGPLRIGLRYRARKNNSFSCNLASCRIILKIRLFLFSKLADCTFLNIIVMLKKGQITCLKLYFAT